MDEEMDESAYRVYVRVDEAGCVTDIGSDVFLENTDGYVEIDAGVGDRFHHAQGNYLDAPLMDGRMRRQWRLVDGVVERIPEEERVNHTEIKPVDPATIAEENILLKAQVQALTERGDFVEDCLAEMAMVVYGL